MYVFMASRVCHSIAFLSHPHVVGILTHQDILCTLYLPIAYLSLSFSYQSLSPITIYLFTLHPFTHSSLPLFTHHVFSSHYHCFVLFFFGITRRYLNMLSSPLYFFVIFYPSSSSFSGDFYSYLSCVPSVCECVCVCVCAHHRVELVSVFVVFEVFNSRLRLLVDVYLLAIKINK